MAAALLAACAGGPRLYEERRADGSCLRQGTLVHGRQEGTWTLWHADGTLQARGEYRDDVRTGPWEHFHPNGVRAMAGRYVDDRQEGLWQYWHPSGALQCAGRFHRGRESGEWTFGDADGTVRQRGCFDDGRRTLHWQGFRADGGREWQGCYLDDRPVGIWQRWDAQGRCSEADHGMPTGCAVVRECWDDGAVRREGVLRDGRPEGLWVSRHPGGARRLEVTFRGGVAAGMGAALLPGGALLATGVVADGRAVGRWSRGDDDPGVELGDAVRPRRPWDGQWSDAALAGTATLDEVLDRWLAELSAPVVPPPRPVAAPPVPPAAPAAPAPERPEAPTDPGAFTVREREELAMYRRYYRDGWLPRQHQLGGDYGIAAGARRLGQGDAARADALLGQPLPVTVFPTADGGELDLATLRGRKILFVILRGFTTQVCVYCFAQTAELVPFAGQLRELGTEVVVLYPGPRSKLDAFLQCYRAEFGDAGPPPYHMVYDPDLQLADRLGVAANLARPSALILDQQGIVRHAYVAESDDNIADRPPATELVRVLEQMPR